MDGWEVTVSHVDYAPGRVGQPHQHPGFVLAYVLEGAVVARIVGQGVSDEERTYRRRDVLRADRRHPPGLEERERYRAGEAAGDDLRKKGCVSLG